MDIQGKIFVNARAIIERTNSGGTEVIVQWRDKRGEGCWEFPGGCIEPYESLYDAVKREVKEETGLTITAIKGEDGYFQVGRVECLKPFSVYQTLEGFVDSIGVHFICLTEGKLLSEGDATKEIKWIGLDQLEKLLYGEKFSNIDKVAAMLYLRELNHD